MRKEELAKILSDIRKYGENILNLCRDNRNIGELNAKITGLSMLIENMENIIPQSIYREYAAFFSQFELECKSANLIKENIEVIVSSLQLFIRYMNEVMQECSERMGKCLCCGEEVCYESVEEHPDYNKIRYGVKDKRADLTGRKEYICPCCGAGNRERLTVLFFLKENMQQMPEGEKVLQIGDNKCIEEWIRISCPQVQYEKKDLDMLKKEYYKNHQNATYEMIVYSSITDSIEENAQMLKSILKSEGKIVVLPPDYFDDNAKREKNEFFLYCLDDRYFEEEMMCQSCICPQSILHVLTKEKHVPLSLGKKYEIDMELCQNGPLVSVILPSYNHEEYVEEALLSILGQSYKNIEILVADDGSTDHTPQILKNYSPCFAKELYFENNAGGGRAQKLMQYAKGKYIALMNSDDIWEKDKLALQVMYMEKHEDCDVCFTWAKYVDENLEEIANNVFIKGNRSRYEWMLYFWEHGNVLCNPSSLVRKTVMEQKYGAACRQVPDFFKWVCIVEKHMIHIIPQMMVKMRRYKKKNSENTSAVSNNNAVREGIEQGSNWLWIIRDMQDDFFKEAFKELMINPKANTEEEIKCEKYFLLLGHRNIFVQNSGIIYFHEIYNDVKECMATKYNYTKRDLGDDTLKKGLGKIFIGNGERG